MPPTGFRLLAMFNNPSFVARSRGADYVGDTAYLTSLGLPTVVFNQPLCAAGLSVTAQCGSTDKLIHFNFNNPRRIRRQYEHEHSASSFLESFVGTTVRNLQMEDLGEINELMIDISEDRIACAVLSFGGFLGMGDKLVAIPWEALRVKQEANLLRLDMEKEKLENAPGFDKDNWPDMTDVTWGQGIYDYYGYDSYWESLEEFLSEDGSGRSVISWVDSLLPIYRG